MLMNSEFIAAQSGHFARRILREAPPDGGREAATVEYAFRVALARRPGPARTR